MEKKLVPRLLPIEKPLNVKVDCVLLDFLASILDHGMKKRIVNNFMRLVVCELRDAKSKEDRIYKMYQLVEGNYKFAIKNLDGEYYEHTV